jgi:hypothetical protein
MNQCIHVEGLTKLRTCRSTSFYIFYHLWKQKKPYNGCATDHKIGRIIGKWFVVWTSTIVYFVERKISTILSGAFYPNMVLLPLEFSYTTVTELTKQIIFYWKRSYLRDLLVIFEICTHKGIQNVENNYIGNMQEMLNSSMTQY